MKEGGKPHPARHQGEPEDELSLFRQATEDVTPLTPHGRIVHDAPRLPPLPLYLFHDERAAILASLEDPVRWDEDTEYEADTSYVRPGLSRQTLRRLRRGEWHTQAELDLHGLTKLEAKQELAEFLHECLRRGARCVRIIHGKGLRSKNREPVLKQHVRHWLMQRDEVLAFVQARPVDGGSGAVMVLLRSRFR
ncbi:MAG: Smr/MutS family protein [Pseudomonadota bacterium]